MVANKTILVAMLAAALLSIGVVSLITAAMAAPNYNPSCIGNPHTDCSDNLYPNGIARNLAIEHLSYRL